ncbi:MAG: two-component sensor histidine kinase [Acidiphilium sp. 37-64-53]|uniref:sensor histidine kinase n=1 Tax=Acidiphilium TaxID=522 RepID=UPI000BD209F2|nr:MULTISPECIES: HAMP domain-containing sensor histidine kinase [Acidiphilium]OYW02722.1 MAG: two-component sensor histidine kinase [Acidiphilium sp. 37-64-53]OZB29320.1 MAG: two-component sensor histidine kinase [Acidiphilium sp. 34-64-41]HQT85359.1 HAMP domain-containing sensor histidine kinase [Acidiphilium rubrum]
MLRPMARRVRHSLSARLLWLTVGVTLLVEVMILLPSLGRERMAWLTNRVTEAHLAGLTVSTAPHGVVDLSTRNELLRLSGTEAIRLVEGGRSILVLPPRGTVHAEGQINIAHETLIGSMVRAVAVVLNLEPPDILVTSPSPLQKGVIVQIVVHNPTLADHLRRYMAHIAALSVAIALVTGLMVYLALDRILVLPMRRLTESIARFRADPEHAAPVAMPRRRRVRDDEIALAASELTAMQTELRAALWRNARLAALGTAVAKISHDLRNILSSALLVADRLSGSDDPGTRRAATTLVTAVERATDLVTKTLTFAREGPPAVLRAGFPLGDLVGEVADQVMAQVETVAVAAEIPSGLAPPLDRTQMFRALFNLIRNAAEAGARHVTVRAASEAGVVTIDIEDDGPGLPEQARANLFRPFTGSARRGGTGLGLAIARDLVRAHGGELDLVATSDHGTLFRITLPTELI